MRKTSKGFDFGNFVITKREIGVSITIIAILLIIGFLISGKISDAEMDRNKMYEVAMKIDNPDLFEYGMRTNVGNAFVYGELKAVDTVTFPEIGGEYMKAEKVEEHYVQKTREVTYTDSNGKTKTRTEVYWEWDVYGREEKRCNEVSFAGVTFNSDKLRLPSESYIDTIKESSRVRFKYYGTATEHTGTIFADLRENTIPDKTEFYKDYSIEDTYYRLTSHGGVIALFWFFWVILIAVVVYGFYYLDNNWLE